MPGAEGENYVPKEETDIRSGGKEVESGTAQSTPTPPADGPDAETTVADRPVVEPPAVQDEVGTAPPPLEEERPAPELPPELVAAQNEEVPPGEEEDGGPEDYDTGSDYIPPAVVQAEVKKAPLLAAIIPDTKTPLVKEDFEIKKRAVEDSVKSSAQLTQESLVEAKNELKSIIKQTTEDDLGKSDEQKNFTCIDYLQILLRDDLKGIDESIQPLYLYDRWNLFPVGLRKEISSIMFKMLTRELGVEGHEELPGEDSPEGSVAIELGRYQVAFEGETVSTARAETSKSLQTRLKEGLIRPRLTINRKSQLELVRKQISNIGDQARQADNGGTEK